MPLIQVTMTDGRTPEQKRALLEAITKATHETLKAPINSIQVWITEVPSAEFMSGGETIAERQGVPLPTRQPPASGSPPAIPGVTVPARRD
jgi:4-oxalocrotonate tautomerase